MDQRVAIVTGGLRGLGRAMTFGLAREGYHILAVGHIDADVAIVEGRRPPSSQGGRSCRSNSCAIFFVYPISRA